VGPVLVTDQYAQWLRGEGLDKSRRPQAPKRKSITLSDKVAALLCLRWRRNGRPLIPDAVRAKGKAAVLAYPIDWDHVIALGLCGPDAFDNLVPLHPEDHKPKTKADKKRMAHNVRLAWKQAEFRARLLRPDPNPRHHPTKRQINAAVRKVMSRPMPGSKKSKYRKRLDGRVELR
jgi:hypothetical protein